MIRTSYVKAGRYFSSEKVKYKSLTRYVLLSVCISTVVNLLTISPLRNSDSFVTEGQWLTFKSIIALLILCGVVLAINLFFCASPSGTLFWAGFLQEIDLFFSSENALSTFLPSRFGFGYSYCWLLKWCGLRWCRYWQRLWNGGFGLSLFFTLLCTVLNLLFFHCRCLWHNDFMMACDMYFRWGHFNKWGSYRKWPDNAYMFSTILRILIVDWVTRQLMCTIFPRPNRRGRGHPVCAIYEKKPVLSYGLFFKYGGEGGPPEINLT